MDLTYYVKNLAIKVLHLDNSFVSVNWDGITIPSTPPQYKVTVLFNNGQFKDYIITDTPDTINKPYDQLYPDDDLFGINSGFNQINHNFRY